MVLCCLSGPAAWDRLSGCGDVMQPVLRLLGRFETATASGSALSISGARAQLLLARLALAQGAALDRSTLSAMLWGERADAQARASLRQSIWTIRQALKTVPDALVTDGDLIRLEPLAVSSDVAQFDRLARSTDPADLEAALALYRGDLLEGVDLLSLAPDGYFLQERSRLRDLALNVVTSLGQGYDRDRNWEQSLRASRRGLTIDPYDEAMHARLVGALGHLGRHREARDHDEAFRSRMKAELGVVTAPLARIATKPAPASVAAPPTTRDAQPAPRRWRVVGGALSALVLCAALFGVWWQKAGNSAAQSPSEPPAAATAQTPFPTRNLAAYDQYLRAEALRLDANDEAALRAVLATYRAALGLDPDFAAAHAGYALVAVALWHRSLDGPAPSLGARAEAYDAAGRALQIDPDNARALIVLSLIQAQDGARSLALTTARQATKAEPGSAEAHANLALILSYSGRTSEARSELTRLQRLDPIPRAQTLLIFGQAAFADARYDAAIADFVAAWPTLPKNALLLEHVAAAMALQGRLRQASQMKDQLLLVMPNANLHLTARRYALLRDGKQNDRLLEGLRRAGLPEWPYGFSGSEAMRLTEADLSAIAAGSHWSGHLGNGDPFWMQSDPEGGFTYHSDRADLTGTQFVRDGELCQIIPSRPETGETCGPVYRSNAGPGTSSAHYFLTADDVHAFSAVD